MVDEYDDKSKPQMVQQRGRFKVTSENLDIDKVRLWGENLRINVFLFLFKVSFVVFTLSFQVVPSPIIQKSHSLQVCNNKARPASNITMANINHTFRCFLM